MAADALSSLSLADLFICCDQALHTCSLGTMVEM